MSGFVEPILKDDSLKKKLKGDYLTETDDACLDKSLKTNNSNSMGA